MLSIKELRDFALAHTRRGQAMYAGQWTEFSTPALCRFLSWHHSEFYKWIQGKVHMPLRVQRAFSKFVGLWEAGLVEFTRYDSKGPRVLRRRETPAPRSRLALAWRENGPPRLTLIARAPLLAPSMPAPAALIRGSDLTKPSR